MNAQFEDPLTFDFHSVKTGPTTYDLLYEFDIDPGWSTYSQNMSDEDMAMGPFPTSISYETAGLTFGSERPSECGGLKTKYDKVFEMELTKFFDRAVFIHSVTVPADFSGRITGFLTLMVCDETKCLPPTDYEFEIDLSESASAADYDKDRFCEGKGLGAVEQPKTDLNASQDVVNDVTPDAGEESMSFSLEGEGEEGESPGVVLSARGVRRTMGFYGESRYSVRMEGLWPS